MDADALLKELWRFDPDVPVERARTPPSSWYTDAAFDALERAVLRRSWLCVARVDQLSRPGACVAGVAAGEPWLVVRGDDGGLRGFVNVCAHHAAEVVTGECELKELVCPYHGWTYDLEGRLQKAPRMAGVADFDKDGMGLRAIDVAAWGHLVFIRFDGDAPPPADTLLELTARLDARATDRLTWWARRTFALDCNWKVFVDNYLDGGYHVPTIHEKLANELDVDTYRTEVLEGLVIQSCGGAGFDERLGDGAIYAWIWPNVMINRYGPVLDVNVVNPLGPERCSVTFDWWFEQTEGEDAEAFIAESIEESTRVQQEDEAVCGSVQRGLRSSGYDRGRYAPRVEHGMWSFHRRLWDELIRAGGGDPGPGR